LEKNLKNYKHRDDCRLCGSTQFELVLPILPSAIGDAFVSEDQLNEVQELYPLDTYLCLNCGHLQNLDIVDPEILFRNYTYRTSASLGLVDHFKKYAQAVVSGVSIPGGSLVVELGSNDGSLLKAYKALGMHVIGVDPAKNIAATATAEGITTLPEFFTYEVAQKILNAHGAATLMCANNVFAHVDNIADIVKGIRSLLAHDGVFVFEVSYVPDIIDNFVFDTIYHEHVSHHALIPLERFFNSLDMTLFNVERVSTKGGSIRGFAQPLSTGTRTKTKQYLQMIEEEVRRRITQPEIYRTFYQEIEKRKQAVLQYIDKAIAEGKTIAAYGASTTATTLLYHFELQNRVKFILDDNPLKFNLYSPGAHIPVYSSDALYRLPAPDIVVILAWQYAVPIMNRHTQFTKSGGKFLIPLKDMAVLP
jgi:SAM-dependent methyltransferase